MGFVSVGGWALLLLPFKLPAVRGESARSGPILAVAAYPEVLVRAYSTGEDLLLTLYPGAGLGPQMLGLARLRPGARYEVRGARRPTRMARHR